MKLGAFSISLAVQDLEVSRKFYEDLGFEVFAGGAAMKYLIMKQGSTLIGLFEKMFEENILTFNPGWDSNAQKLDGFMDVRKIQEELASKGHEFIQKVDSDGSGPGSLMLKDPDGNLILLDQHI